MKIMKKKNGWFVLYGIFITLVFLYVLFPSDVAKARLEQAVRSSGFVLRSESFAPSLPFGVKMRKVIFSSDRPATTYFQGDSLDLQLNPLNFFQKKQIPRFSGKAYGGRFSGRFGFYSFSGMYPPTAVKLNFDNIDLENILSSER
jgi:type II secretion system protein N